MEVYVRSLNKCIECEVVKENNKTVWIKLPNGDVIKRHLNKNKKENEIMINNYKPEVKYETTPVTDSQDDEGNSEEG